MATPSSLLRLLSVLVVLSVPVLCLSAAISAPHVRVEYQHTDWLHEPVVSSAWPTFSWRLNQELQPSQHGTASLLARNISQLAFRLQLRPSSSSHLCRCSDHEGCTAYATGEVRSATTVHSVPHDVSPLLPDTTYALSVRYWSSTGAVSDWFNGTFRTSLTLVDSPAADAESARLWIGHPTVPVSELRRDFFLAGNVSRAVVYWSGLGYSDVWLNGEKIDVSRRLDPGVTDYDRLVLYSSLDVTARLMAGHNAIAVVLGHGWYTQEQYPRGAQYPSFGPPRLWLALHIEYSDCTLPSTVVQTDDQWTARLGPVIHNSLYHGEIFDARLDLGHAISQPHLQDNTSLWLPVMEMPSPCGTLVYQSMPPIRAGSANLHWLVEHEPPIAGAGARNGRRLEEGGELQPVSWWSPDQLYVQVWDFGQVLAGHARVCLSGPRGSSVRISYAEILEPNLPHSIFNNPNGSFIYANSLRSSAGGDVYKLRGSTPAALECYEPRFAYAGFRYVQVSGVMDGAVITVTAIVVHSETAVIGRLQLHHPVLDQLQQNVQWSQLSNLFSIPTDCPQRDERQGWMGDAALSVDQALYNFDLLLFYLNFLSLIRSSQMADGSLPDTVPFTRGFLPAEAAWGTAFVTIAWRLWQHTGDTTILQSHYAGMKAWLHFLTQQYDQLGLARMPFFFADWLQPPPWPAVNGSLVSAYAFMHDLSLMTEIATICYQDNDSAAFHALYGRLTSEFHLAFFNSSIEAYGNGEQTANILALSLPGVVPVTLWDQVLNSLLASLRQLGHLTSGIIGTSLVFDLLSTSGHHDLALSLLSSTAYPSYGFMLSNPHENATALWEGWDVPFRGSEMSSRNHHMMSGVSAWMYRHVAGLQLEGRDADGLRIRIHPRFTSDASVLPLVRAEHFTLLGSVHIEIQRLSNLSYRLTLVLPPTAVALLIVEPPFPGNLCERLTEGERILWLNGSAVSSNSSLPSGIWSVTDRPSSDGPGLLVRLGSGSYVFNAQWQQSTSSSAANTPQQREWYLPLLFLLLLPLLLLMLAVAVRVIVRLHRSRRLDRPVTERQSSAPPPSQHTQLSAPLLASS